MNGKTEIVTLNAENAVKYGCPCFLNPKNAGHQTKLAWLPERFGEGLSIKLLFIESEKRLVGFIEYVPGEYAWRSVNAGGYDFIHCIWVSANKYKDKGFGSLLVKECLEDARKGGKYGVATVTSTGPFIAGKELFSRNGFEIVAQDGGYELMVHQLNNGPLPGFANWEQQLGNYRGLNIVYSNQCPWVARSIPELAEIAAENELDLTITELKTAEQAQKAPSIYSVFNLVYDGKLLADHYVSTTRFRNILKKELRLIG